MNLLLFILAADVVANTASTPRASVPSTPRGLPTCQRAMVAPKDLPRADGETVRYVIDVDGLSVGTIDFQVTRQGAYQGQPVTEYRSLFKLDALVATLIPVNGRAASLVPTAASTPLVAMNRYSSGKAEYQEDVNYTEGGAALSSVRRQGTKSKRESRRFLATAYDFVSAFYMLRALPPDFAGCTLIYGNQRAYTVWLAPDGAEEIRTPVGLQPTSRYQVRFASERAKQPTEARLWLAQSVDRLPYRVQIDGPHPLEARIHLYEKGRP